MNYFVLTISEDGDVYLEQKTREEILEDIKDGEIEAKEIAKEITETDLMEAGSKTYIFKGELVVPTEKEVVKEWEI